jgi:regulator of sirC expression with transglutaminase-like and TPR domain
MTNQSETRRVFAEMVSRKEEDIKLAKAALLLAKGEYPDLDIDKYLRKIELMAEEIKRRTGQNTNPHYLISEINRHLFSELGFRGNENDYYNPRNSFLNDVLDRQTGIPISLSVLYMEIADRAGLHISGVAFPGHFIVMYSGVEGKILIDPFNKGRILSEKDCQEMLNRIYVSKIWLRSEFLETITKSQILTRMLHNLKGIYLNSKNFLKALSAVDMILIIDPYAIKDLRDRGLLYYHLECFAQALSDLEAYLSYAPKAEDAEVIRHYITQARKLNNNYLT